MDNCEEGLLDIGDLRYFLFLFGAIKVGYKVCQISQKKPSTSKRALKLISLLIDVISVTSK